ncbi:hypothetical protein EJB05_03630, partial [Eragrostis curvula]
MAAGKIKTVVVLVQENRSFDHMLGWMKSLNPEIDGVTGDETNFVGDRAVRFSDRSEYVDPDPGHSMQAIYEQVYGTAFVDASATPITPPGVPTPPMSGFAQQAEKERPGIGMAETVMSGFRPDAVPVYRELVREFGVCDRWFASNPASTQPNRLFVHSATSHGLVSNDTKQLVAGLPQRTIFDSLHDAGRSFGIYYQYPPSTLFYRNLRQLKYVGNFHPFDLAFKRHCREGKLPNYVVIEQRYFDLKILPGNDDHPSHDVAEGQRFVKEVYEALRSSPQWEEMLLVITYDEHGGFYDHVPTPVLGVPSPDDIVSAAPFFFKFDRLGVRVPAIFVSPWIDPGTVAHRPDGPYPTSEFEHSSIPATVKKIFNLETFLTKRDAWAGTFDCVLTRDTPRTDCPRTLPEPVKLRSTDAVEEHTPLSEFQEELVQLAAVLNGDHTKETYPHKLVQGMTVAEAAKYCNDAFKAFLDECDRCKKCGEDGCYIPTLKPSLPDKKNKSGFASKVLACLACGHGTTFGPSRLIFKITATTESDTMSLMGSDDHCSPVPYDFKRTGIWDSNALSNVRDIRGELRSFSGTEVAVFLTGVVASVKNAHTSNIYHEHGSTKNMASSIAPETYPINLHCLHIIHRNFADFDIILKQQLVNGLCGVGHIHLALERGLQIRETSGHCRGKSQQMKLEPPK